MAEGTKIPNPLSRLLQVMGGDEDEQNLFETVNEAVLGIGGALMAAGVGMAEGPASLGALGGLVVDMKLPNMVATAQGQGADMGRVRSKTSA